MTISSALNAGVAGLFSNATRLATISDNIANSSTFGYKRVETDFSSMVISTTGGSYSAGGVRTSTHRLIDARGSLTSTSNSTDLAVRGRGMIPVVTAGEYFGGSGKPEMLLTTTSSFRTDANGYLSTDSGMLLMGWPALSDGTFPSYPRDTSDSLEPVQVNLNLSSDPTTAITMSLNLPATATIAGANTATQDLSVEYYDNVGTSQNVLIEFSPTIPAAGSSNEWSMVLRDSASDGAVIGEYIITFDDTRGAGGTIATVTTVSGGAYDPATGSLIAPVAGGPIELNIGKPGETDGLTQLSDAFAPISISKDGSTIGNLTSVEVDQNGFVHALFDTGIVRTIFQIPLVDLPNPNGMIAVDQQTYLPSPSSGSYFLWNAGDGPTGDIIAYAREESTTDVAGELTAMIQTQRAYSSNAKVIQTVDEMLQETTNIKR